MIIEVLHFYLPNGRAEWEEVEIKDFLKEKYELIQKFGCRLTAEVLTNGKVSLCIENPDMDDFDIKVCENGPKVIEILENMIDNFNEREYLEYIKHYENE